VRPVPVDYQTRESVAFAPDQSARITVIQPFPAKSAGLFNTPEKEIAIEFLALPGKAPGHDLRPGIIDGTTQRSIPTVFD
jgi:hypothetical protein